MLLCKFFFFKQKTAYEMRISDWSSDVCSSDLVRLDRVLEPGLCPALLEATADGADVVELDVAVEQRQLAAGLLQAAAQPCQLNHRGAVFQPCADERLGRGGRSCHALSTRFQAMRRWSAPECHSGALGRATSRATRGPHL